jgi:hypothetical protein
MAGRDHAPTRDIDLTATPLPCSRGATLLWKLVVRNVVRHPLLSLDQTPERQHSRRHPGPLDRKHPYLSSWPKTRS